MENINLIRKIAWSFHNTTGVEWDDLFQEAALAYYEGLSKYKSKEGKISTFMWHVISSRVLDFLRKEKKNIVFSEPVEDIFVTTTAYQPSFFEELTKDAQEIAKMILIYWLSCLIV